MNAWDKENLPVVIYDGECKFCQRSVNFLKMNQPDTSIRFISSYSPESVPFLEKYKIPGQVTAKTVILIDKNKPHFKSTAVLKALQKSRGFWRFFGLLLIIPSFIRNLVYDFFAFFLNHHATSPKNNCP